MLCCVSSQQHWGRWLEKVPTRHGKLYRLRLKIYSGENPPSKYKLENTKEAKFPLLTYLAQNTKKREQMNTVNNLSTTSENMLPTKHNKLPTKHNKPVYFTSNEGQNWEKLYVVHVPVKVCSYFKFCSEIKKWILVMSDKGYRHTQLPLQNVE